MRVKLPTALPIRIWLLLTLVAVIGLPLAAMTIATALAFQGAFKPTPDFESVRSDVVRDVHSWNDPAWQEGLSSRIAQTNMHVVLLDRNGRVLYVDTPSAPPSTTALAPGAGADIPPFNALVPSPVSSPAPGEPATTSPDAVVTTVAQPISRMLVTEGGQQIGVALFTLGEPKIVQPGGRRPSTFDYVLFELTGPWRVPIASVGLITFLVVLLLAAWFLGRALLRPLAALGAAARHIAAGDLTFALPHSRISEVAAVGTAFDVMAGALRQSLYRQAEVEGERRLFITAIVHDLRTPLFALRGYLEGLTSGIARSPQRAAEYLAVCQDKVAVLDRLVADLFTYARMEYLEQAPARERLELGELLRRAAEGLHPQREERGITLALDGPDTPCLFEGDDHLLTRAVENLLDNAIRHTPEGGRVCITWQDTADGWRFSVADTGPGIAPVDLPHLFAPMYRGESSRNRQTGGAGLGLTIARRVLVAHGGDLAAANQQDGGAIFTATLPAAHDQRTEKPCQPFALRADEADAPAHAIAGI